MKFNPRLNSKLFKAGLKVAKLLQSNGFESFWVGGVVRNILLKRPSDNVDIATDALPAEVERILKKNKLFYKSMGQGRQLGTILTIVNSVTIEIATFRSEGRYSDKRHPDQVRFIKNYPDDAKRRDFTINALYFDPVKKELYDPTGRGIKDQESRIIRFVGDPKKRIDEDALRMLRGVRLATQFGLKLEKNSFAAIKTRAKYIQGVSGERVKAELDKILTAKNRVEGMRLLDQTGVFKFIIPEIDAIKKFRHDSKLYHLEGSIFDHTLLALSKVKLGNLDLLYALLFHDIGKPAASKRVLKKEGWVISTKGHADSSAQIFLKFAHKFKFSRQNRNNIEWIIRNHMAMESFGGMKIIKQLKMAVHPEFGLLLRHWQYDQGAIIRQTSFDNYYKKYLQSLRAGKRLLLKLETKKQLLKKIASGNLIMKYSKLKPGLQLGLIIDRVKAKIILGEIKNKSDLKTFLKKILKRLDKR